jgi:hypothetical protein
MKVDLSKMVSELAVDQRELLACGLTLIRVSQTLQRVAAASGESGDEIAEVASTASTAGSNLIEIFGVREALSDPIVSEQLA